jgi:hypothetical protein
MAWGIWNKIKNGIKKVGNAASWVNEKIVKPYLKPVAAAVAPILDGFVPGLGTGIKKGLDYGSGFTENLAPRLKTFGSTNRKIDYI